MKKYIAVAAALVTLGVGTLVSAGLKYSTPVSISLSGRNLSGSLGGARNSPDSAQYIQIEYYAGGASTEVIVLARAANGTFAYCWSSDPNIVTMARAVSEGASISVNWNANNECTFLYVSVSSYDAPKIP